MARQDLGAGGARRSPALLVERASDFASQRRRLRYRARTMNGTNGTAQRLARIAAPLIIGLIFLALWDAAVRIGDIPRYILPGPLLVAETLWRDGPSLLGLFFDTTGIT